MKKAGLSGGPSAKAKRESRARVQTTTDGGPRPKTPDRTYREGRYLIAGYFDASVKSSLRQIQVSHLKKIFQLHPSNTRIAGHLKVPTKRSARRSHTKSSGPQTSNGLATGGLPWRGRP